MKHHLAVAAASLLLSAGARAEQPITSDEAVRRIWALPEVAAQAAAVSRTAGGKVRLSLRVDSEPRPGCQAGQADCRFEIGVGESRPEQWVRWAGFSVDAFDGRIEVFEPMTGELVPYATWRGTPRDRDAFPAWEAGRGPLGYGVPDRVVAGTAGWKHPVRKPLEARGLTVTRVELYQGSTYPVFFVSESDPDHGLAALLAADPKGAAAWGQEVLKANAGWAFELRFPDGRRVRLNGALARAGAGFQPFRDGWPAPRATAP